VKEEVLFAVFGALAIGALHVRRQTVIHVTKMLNLRNLARILGVSIPERLFSFGTSTKLIKTSSDPDPSRSRRLLAAAL
jgi:hypothetical protein